MTPVPPSIEELNRLELLKRFGCTTAGKRVLLEPEKVQGVAAEPRPLAPTPSPPQPQFSIPSDSRITGQPEHEIGYQPLFGLESLVDVWYLMFPDIRLHDWQAQELMRMSGWPTGRKEGDRIHWYKSQPNLATYVCANGSGKDKVLIATAAVGLPLLYKDMYVVGTSSSHDQLKNQTQTHIAAAIRALNARLGMQYYDSVEFHHRHPLTPEDDRGGEIHLFATDEAGRAEGWHPLTPTGRLALVVNEAKTIAKPIMDALDRCRGYSNWYEISSPGIRSGQFYRNWKACSKFSDGAIAEPFKYFGRKVDAFDCPHISKQEIDLVLSKHGYNSFIYQTSILANFAEAVEDVIIPFSIVEACETVIPFGHEIGIGMDCAAGGDETVVWVRRGNKPVAYLAFVEADVEAAAIKIDEWLGLYKSAEYIFNADDGGVGRGLIDILTNRGWYINRMYNQSAALNPSLYANFGAESYRHVRDLFEAKNIIPPADEKTLQQLCTRRDSTKESAGKFKLQPKKKLRSEGIESPDRSDAFVLCFWSHELLPAGHIPEPTTTTLISQDELVRMAMYQPAKFAALFRAQGEAQRRGRYTLLSGNLTQPSNRN